MSEKDSARSINQTKQLWHDRWSFVNLLPPTRHSPLQDPQCYEFSSWPHCQCRFIWPRSECTVHSRPQQSPQSCYAQGPPPPGLPASSRVSNNHSHMWCCRKTDAVFLFVKSSCWKGVRFMGTISKRANIKVTVLFMVSTSILCGHIECRNRRVLPRFLISRMKHHFDLAWLAICYRGLTILLHDSGFNTAKMHSKECFLLLV